jgi:hypothetical protein
MLFVLILIYSCSGSFLTVNKYKEPTKIVIIEGTSIYKADNIISGSYRDVAVLDTLIATGETAYYYQVKVDNNIGYVPNKNASLITPAMTMTGEVKNGADLISTSYDKFLDLYTYSLREKLEIKSAKLLGSKHSVDLSAFVLKGKDIPMLSFNLEFTSINTNWSYLTTHEVIFLLDGKRLWLKVEKQSSSVGMANLCLEQLIFVISKADFETMAYAKVIEGRLGVDEFKLSYKDREGFRALISSAKL